MSRAFVNQSLTSTGLLLVAVLILATSLISTNHAASGVTRRFSTLNFYWGKEILPDHPFYPLLMIGDRVQLLLTATAQQPRLRLRYAERRYQRARALAEQHKTDLAISTLSKSQIYVLDAARQMTVDGLTADERQILRSALDHSLYRMQLFLAEYPQLDTPMLRSLRAETQSQLTALRALAQ